MEPSIQPCTPDDIETLSRLSAEAFVQAFARDNAPEDLQKFLDENYDPGVLSEQMKAPGSSFFFIYQQATLAGYLKLNVGEQQTEPMGNSALEVERIYLLQTFRGQNLGQALMDFAIDYARGKDLETIWLGVWEHNQPAQKFYRKCGFTPFGSHTFMVGNDAQTDLLLQRPVSQ